MNEQTFDLVVVGSGGGGLVAALAAVEAGLRPVLLEKQAVLGGSTGMSGGVIWMPDNPLMRAEGVPDSFEEGMTYLQSAVGDPDQPSSIARRTAFLTVGPEMISFIQDQGVKLVRCEGYADYYDNIPGGHARGRSVEGVPWDAKQLGEWHGRIIPGMARTMGLAVRTNEVRSLTMYAKSLRSFVVAARVALRTYRGRLMRKDLVTNGESLVSQLTKILVDKHVPIWLDTAVEELIVEDGVVVGVRATRGGRRVDIRGERGVLLSAGGFERNAEFRSKVTAGTQPNDGSFSMANPGNTGEVLQAAMALGAKVDYMDDAVWLLVPRLQMAGSTLMVARQYPHTIMVNKRGERFVNESNSYLEVGRAMYANDAVPGWIVFDEDYRQSVPWVSGMPKLRQFTAALPGRIPQAWLDDEWILQADTLEQLAQKMGVPAANLVATVGHFNVGAAKGEDPDFGRGASAYNKVLGHPGNKVNAAVGPVARGPFYATQLHPGDVGTIGGVVCNEHAQVLGQDDTPIPGLYATGNMAATVTGRVYPGAGASISNTMVFGYVAARHAAAARAASPQGPAPKAKRNIERKLT